MPCKLIDRAHDRAAGLAPDARLRMAALHGEMNGDWHVAHAAFAELWQAEPVLDHEACLRAGLSPEIGERGTA